MRTTWVLVSGLVLFGACTRVEPPHRWPNHRKDHDAQLEQLLTLTKQQAVAIEALNARLAKLEAATAPTASP